MTPEQDLAAIGADLVHHAEKDADFTKRRGVIDELFPYVYQASRRMSTRAICRWLWETKRIRVSPVTIAKALREAGRYWAGFYKSIAPAAITFARAHRTSPESFLEEEEAFEALCRKVPTLSGTEAMDAYQDAEATLRRGWFAVIDARARKDCLAAVAALNRAAKTAGTPKGKRQGV